MTAMIPAYMAIPLEQIQMEEESMCTTPFATEHSVKLIPSGLASAIQQELCKDQRPLKARKVKSLIKS
jgi:hypothetical protein